MVRYSARGGVWEAESNIELPALVSTPAAADWDASVTVERINLWENTAKASRRKCEFDQMREVLFVREAVDLALATSHLPQSSSASRLTAGASEFSILSQSGERPERKPCCLLPAAVLPIVRRAVIPVVAVVCVVTPVVGADVGGLPPLEIRAPIGIAEPSLWPRFVDVDARSISFCRLSWHGQDCSRHHREDAEQGIAGLAHSPLHWIKSAVSASAGEDH